MSTDVTRPGPLLEDTGERMIPPREGEVSVVWSRHRFAYAFAATLAPGHAALDVGCGTGYGTALLAEHARSAFGIDASADAIAYCRAHYARPNLAFETGRAEDLAHEAAFGLVVSFQTIEHVADADGFLRRLKRACTPGGAVVVTTPNVRRKLPAGEANPFHLSEMTHSEFAALFARHFARHDVLGVGSPPRPAWQRWLAATPLPRWGRRLGRGNAIKKVAVRSLGLTDFAILRTRVAEDAADLLGVGYV